MHHRCKHHPRWSFTPSLATDLSPVKVTLLLADFAQVSEGKINLIGGGWTVTGPMPAPSAIAAKIEIPWDQANVRHTLLFELLDQDGHPVAQPHGPGGSLVDIRVEADLEVGRPAGVAPGTPLDVPMAVLIPPLLLQPGGRFTWRLSIDQEFDDDWQVAFSTRSIPPGMTLPPGLIPPQNG